MAATQAVIFLRGVNVGGITVKSAALGACVGGLDQVTAARTVLATGNVVVRTSLRLAALKKAAEAALREAFGYDAWVVVLSAVAVADLVAACPYPSDDAKVHAYVTLSSDPARLDEIEGAAEQLPPPPGVPDTGQPRLVRLEPHALAWQAAVGGSLDSPLPKLLAKARYKPHITTRNLRTLIKVTAVEL